MPILNYGSVKIRTPDETEKMHTLKAAIWLTVDRKRAVPAGVKKEAKAEDRPAFLLGGKGSQIPDELAKQYGIVDGLLPGQEEDGVQAGSMGRAGLVTATTPDGVNTAPGTPAAGPGQVIPGDNTTGTLASAPEPVPGEAQMPVPAEEEPEPEKPAKPSKPGKPAKARGNGR